MSLRETLQDAEGVSEYAIVIIGDIRAFSDFSDDHESPDVATYIREVFIKLIDDYFPFATFYKSTGDGLLMTVHFNRDNVVEMLKRTVSASLRCVEEFPDIARDNPMIMFETPRNIGFGLSRGTVCCIVSHDHILDYSGHLLNLAARLMDLARPRGVVLDGTFGFDLLDEDVREQFEPMDAYIRGVAEQESHKIYVQKDQVVLPKYAQQPYNVVPLSKGERKASG